jgi:hypothetical protein
MDTILLSHGVGGRMKMGNFFGMGGTVGSNILYDGPWENKIISAQI